MAGIYRVDVDGNVNAAIKFRKMPENIGNALKSQLKAQIAPQVEANIKRGMPVSPRTNSHMKYANSLKVFTMGGYKGFRNVGFYIQPQKDWWYMKFPNNGSGTSRGKGGKFFMQSGLSQSVPLIKRTIDAIVSKELGK